MNIAVCDDEKIFRDYLIRNIKDYRNNLDIFIHEYSSGEDLLHSLEKRTYDVIFLDIEMKGIDGILTAKKIRECNIDVMIIFLTSHTEFAMEGYEVNAFRFLDKKADTNKLIETIKQIDKAFQDKRHILLHTGDEDILVSVSNIIYVEAIRNDIYVHYMSQNSKVDQAIVKKIRKPLKDMLTQLNIIDFYQCHRSYIINLNHVYTYTRQSVTMNNNNVIPVSRGKYIELREKILNRH